MSKYLRKVLALLCVLTLAASAIGLVAIAEDVGAASEQVINEAD